MHLRKAVSVCPSVRPSIGDVDVFEEMQGSWFLITYYIITYLNKSGTRRRPLRVFFSHLSSTRRPFWLSRAVLICCTPNTPFCYSQKKEACFTKFVSAVSQWFAYFRFVPGFYFHLVYLLRTDFVFGLSHWTRCVPQSFSLPFLFIFFFFGNLSEICIFLKCMYFVSSLLESWSVINIRIVEYVVFYLEQNSFYQ